MKRSRLIWGAAGLLLATLLGAIRLTVARSTASPSWDDELPVAVVKRGSVNLEVHTTGELHATQSMMLTAPAVGGSTLEITHLVRSGTPLHKGDVVVEFDPSEQRYIFEQSSSELFEAEQDMIKAKADAAVQAAEDKVALLKAGFAVRRAELDVQKSEIVSGIDRAKNQLALEQARGDLAKLEHDIHSHATSGQAGIDLAREKRTKAQLKMDEARQNIEKMRVLSPIDGLVALQKNRPDDFVFRGVSLPDYHVGDQAQPGTPIAEVLDPRDMQLTAQVSELERSNIQIGQSAEVEFYAFPGRIYRGRVKSVGGTAVRRFWDIGALGKYEVTVQLSNSDARLRPGMTAAMVIEGEKRNDVLYLPRQAVFVKDGKSVVFVKTASSFAQHEVKVEGANESRAAIQELKAGAEIVLIDPTSPRTGPALPVREPVSH